MNPVVLIIGLLSDNDQFQFQKYLSGWIKSNHKKNSQFNKKKAIHRNYKLYANIEIKN